MTIEESSWDGNKPILSDLNCINNLLIAYNRYRFTENVRKTCHVESRGKLGQNRYGEDCMAQTLRKKSISKDAQEL